MKSIQIGDRFEKLIVTARAESDGRTRRLMWLCECDCGTQTKAATGELNSGHKRSCGCLKIGLFRRNATKHGRYREPTYSVWLAMKNRCSNSRHPSFRHYGGRGITVCERWRLSYLNFVTDMGEKQIGLTIDRIDNNKGYWCGKLECPECAPLGRSMNCRWADWKTQANNRRPTLKLKKVG